MPVRKIQGYRKGSDMPAELRAKLGVVRSFDTVEQVFYKAASPASVAGTDYDIPNEPDCYDQKEEGSCVINAATGAMNVVLAVDGQKTAMLARNFLYYLCREVMGTISQDSGTYTHLAVERLGNIGVCSEQMWPYSQDTMYDAPSQECYPEASDNKATGWFNLTAAGDARLAQLETSIRSNHPVIYGAPVGQALQAYQAGQILTIPDASTIEGGHSTCVVGVRYINGSRVWRIRNSWGTDFGDNGHFLIDDAYMSWAQLDDLWAVTRMSPLMF